MNPALGLNGRSAWWWQAEDLMDVSTDRADSDEGDDEFQLDSDVEPASSNPGSRRSSTRPRRAAASKSNIIVDLTSDSDADEIRSPVQRRPASDAKPAAVKVELATAKPEPGHVKTEGHGEPQAEPLQVGSACCSIRPLA